METEDIENLKTTLAELSNRSDQLSSAINALTGPSELDLSERVLLAEKVLALDDCISRTRILLVMSAATMSDRSGPFSKTSSEGQSLLSELTQGRQSWDAALKEFWQQMTDEQLDT
jgi:hypothetical protein